MVFNLKNAAVLLGAATFLTGMAGCNPPSKSTNGALPVVKLRQGWFPWAGYAGEVTAMQGADSLNGIKLQVDAGADNIDPMKMVISGQDNFGITSAESVILANQKGAGLVAIAVVNYRSPTVFISLKGSGISRPSDFLGHKVGILSGSETETVYRTLIRKLKLDESKITEVEAPYDLKTFIYHAFDVYPGFIYSEPLALDKQHIGYNLIRPSDYGVSLMGAVYFTTKKYADANPKLVQAFVDALATGWQQALKDPASAIHYLKLYDKGIDEQRELESLKRGAAYFGGEDGKILYASDTNWNTLDSALVALKKIGRDVVVKQCYNNAFVLNYYRQTKY